MAVHALDRHLAVPARAHDLRQAAGIVAVGLVQLQGERRLDVPSIKADHGQAQLPQLVPVPGRQGTALQTDAHRLGRPRADGRSDCLRGGGALAFPDHLAAAIDDTDRGLLLRDVQSDILFHASSPQRVRAIRPRLQLEGTGPQ